ncbi:MAG: hypothetical protein QHH10_10975 [Peptococcaceae bacterium]|jgi:Flp pilus assembly CpaE family ATPase|nr:hypothetical protein [Peptococcaceae bacterium]MDH7525822.1 hypothetical protein [Peptococcaceae bacterium]
MKAILATNNHKIDRYITTTHQDILVLAQVYESERCFESLNIHKPDLVVFSDALIKTHSWAGQREAIERIKETSPGASLVGLFTRRKLTSRQEKELQDMGIRYLFSPITGPDLSVLLYDVAAPKKFNKSIKLIAVWSPKPGDGASLTTEAVAQLLWANRTYDEEMIGVLDFNIRTPSLKYRFKLDEARLIDELLPYIGGGFLTAGLLEKYARAVQKKNGLRFVGGIRRPEFYSKYHPSCFNGLCEAAGDLFSKTVIDAGNVIDHAGTITALKNADLVLAVLQPNYVSKQCLKHSLGLFPAYGINPHKIKVVINRFSPGIDDAPELIASGLDVEVIGTLSDLGPAANMIGDTSVFDDAANRAVSSYLASLNEILEKCGLSTEKDKKKKGGIFSRVFVR